MAEVQTGAERFKKVSSKLAPTNIDLEAEIETIHNSLTAVLTAEEIPLEKITGNDIRRQSVLYMIY